MVSMISTEATAIGGRTGSVASYDGALRLKLAKTEGRSITPEALLAAAFAVSFLDTLRGLASEAGRDLAGDANVTARVEALLDPALAGPPLAVTLFVDLADIAADAARALTDRARATCPYARAFDTSKALKVQVS